VFIKSQMSVYLCGFYDMCAKIDKIPINSIEADNFVLKTILFIKMCRTDSVESLFS
jgi:hypothetical protein